MSHSPAPELEALLAGDPGLRAVEVLLPDMNGVLRGKRVGRNELAALFGRGINMPASACIMDTRGHVIAGAGYGTDDGDPDYLCRPVAGSLAPVPWLGSAVAQCLLEMYRLDGEPFFADSRQVLKRVLRRLADDGLYPTVAVELEFYLLLDDPALPPVPRTGRLPGTHRYPAGPQMYSVEDLQELDPLFDDLASACEVQSLPASTAISEYGPGQFEINLHHVPDAALACDHAVLLRRAIRNVARQRGLAATFMAKPFTGHGGSGMHVHVSLQDRDGRNVLAEGEAPERPGPALRAAAAGLIALMPEAMAIFCPNANSYRRLQPGCFAPIAPNWGYNHRNLAVRIPVSGVRDRRLEHRVAGADANPYLVVAAVLAGLHHGLRNGLAPPPMVGEGEVVEERIGLPTRWEAALDAFAGSAALADYLGPEFHRLFALARRFECDAFHAEVGNLDYDWYLRTL
jgi:glutamine synthetase